MNFFIKQTVFTLRTWHDASKEEKMDDIKLIKLSLRPVFI